MTDLKRKVLALKDRLTEARSRKDALVFDDDAEAGQLETAVKEVRGLEERFDVAEAMLAAEEAATTTITPKNDGEAKEIRALRSKANVSAYMAAAIDRKDLDGAEAEYTAALGLPAGQMPIDLLDPPEVETRAITPGPANETVTSTRPTVPAVFARTDAAALGINMPMVSSGEAHYPALTTAPPAGMKAKDAAADSTAGAFTLTKRTPLRLTGQFQFRVEDIALFPSMEQDLRAGISAQMGHQLDSQIVAGDGSSPNLSSLFHQATDVTAATAVETFATGVSRFAALVDGTHANGWGDIRALIGTDTFSLYAGLFQANGDQSLYDYLMGKLGALRVSTRVPDVASTAQKGIVVLGAQGQPITVPVWRGIEFISDPYTKAAEGQRLVTALSLVGSPFIPYTTSQVKEIHPKLST